MQRDCERKADELGSDSTAAVKTFTNFHFPYLINKNKKMNENRRRDVGQRERQKKRKL